MYKVHNTPYTAIQQKGKLLGNKVHNTPLQQFTKKVSYFNTKFTLHPIQQFTKKAIFKKKFLCEKLDTPCQCGIQFLLKLEF